MNGRYICIDLKSFYASVECVERGLDPMTTNLVVADPERSGGTICLAVSPSMKKLGVRNRCRVFEIPKNIDYIMAPPRMQKYIDYAAAIYGIYLRYISKDDIHVYSIDEAFLDAAPYLRTYGMTAREVAVMLMDKVYEEIGVKAAAGVGSNLYVTKIALDILAKHSPGSVAELDEESYRRRLWDHTPLTDFWRVGRGTARHLANLGIFTMRQLAHYDEEVIYRHFGIDAEIMIDHAWGRETVSMADIKAYRPHSRSLSSGQVLMRDYTFGEGRIVLREMVEKLCLDLVEKGLLTQSLSVYVMYSGSCGGGYERWTSPVPAPTCSETVLCEAALKKYDELVDRGSRIRRFGVSCNDVEKDAGIRQMTFFDSFSDVEDADRKIQRAVLDIKEKFGKNAIFKSADLQEAATALERNRQIGGHKSGE